MVEVVEDHLTSTPSTNLDQPPPTSRMLRFAIFALMVVAVSCGESSGPGAPSARVFPLVDSLFVGDTVQPGGFNLAYIDENGVSLPATTIRWRSLSPAIATIDSLNGRVVGIGRGNAVIEGTTRGVTGRALVVVSRSLDVTLLLDTIYMMPGDTFTAPVDVRRKGGSPPAVRFAPSPNPSVYTIDTVTGRITAVAQGLATRLVARADTIADTGAVEVVVLTDTIGGKGFFTLFGSITRQARTLARAQNYERQGGSQAFRINSYITAGGVTIENVVVTLLAPLTAAGVQPIDSITPNEAFFSASDPICRPARPWALWSTRTSNVELEAVSRPGGTISIARIVTVANGSAISGSFRFDARRTDFYGDPLGTVAVRGTFVAPLITGQRIC